MKRITFLAVIVAFLSVSAAKAQVGVHVGLNFRTPYYAPRHVVYVNQGPAYYPPAPVYEDAPYDGYGYYHRRYLHRGYYGPSRAFYYNRFHRGYRRW